MLDATRPSVLQAAIKDSHHNRSPSQPQVKYDAETAKDTGKAKGSIFDALEDLDYEACLDKCVAISNA